MPLPTGAFPARAEVVEVGPRDGLQSEPERLPTADKIRYLLALAAAGYRQIEATSFVHPKWVPQLSDAAEVARALVAAPRPPGLRYSALVPNLRGLESFLASGLDLPVVFVAASETFSRRNTNKSVAEAFVAAREVALAAHAAGRPIRAYLSTCFGCPYEGPVDPDRVRALVHELLGFEGVYQVSVSDTIGVATPGQVRSLLAPLVAELPAERLALHFHDTRGMGLANVLMGLSLGIATFDSSSGGLGGCPYAPSATGNIATEELLYMLQGLGVETGISLPAVAEASRTLALALGRSLPSRYLRALDAARERAGAMGEELPGLRQLAPPI